MNNKLSTKKARAPFIGLGALALFLLGGCGSMPNVTARYYHAKATVEIVVTQTAICTEGDKGVLSTQVAVLPSYTRDDGRKSEPVLLDKLGSGFTKADAVFEFYADGRLKSVNSVQTGQAAEGLKSLVSLGLAGGPFSMVSEEEEKTACELIRGTVGAGKALTIVSRATTDFSTNLLLFDQMSVSRDAYRQLQSIYGKLSGKTDWVAVEPMNQGTAKNGQILTLVEPAMGTVFVFVKRGDQEMTFEGSVWVPQHGKSYSLPIQKGPWFGENVFELALSESGQVTKLRYSSTPGVNGTLGAASSAVSATGGPTLGDKVDQAKLEADLIYQQQRFVLCQADPTNCPK